jgi:serine/threonine-protein kinase
MGEVYRARDTKLGREVAIKTLPAAFTADAERLARFEREARVLATLNHPHIGAIYGLEEVNGTRGLVLELVEGETLAERVAAGPVPITEALAIASQVADALDAAHERGIVHRDLKPANVKVTPDGTVKVLDFGLAKVTAGSAADVDLSQSPTVTAAGTREGVIVGTAAYMSPEQARGRPLDKRTDIWSFGCVLYELLTGRRAFPAETVSDTIVAILGREPNWGALPVGTPAHVRVLIERCLQKDPKQRLRDIGDVRLSVDDELATTSKATATGRPHRSRAIAWSVALVVGIITGAGLWSLRTTLQPFDSSVARLVMPLPAGDRPLQSTLLDPLFALSPDGSRLAYVHRSADGPQIYVRAWDQFEFAPLPGTEGATSPFFSPDGEWLAFFAQRKLKKVSTLGGEPIIVCDVGNPNGASWGPDDDIVFASIAGSGLAKVSANGGAPQMLTTVDARAGEAAHGWPQWLPGGRAVLFSIRSSATSSWDDAQVVVQSLETGERRVVVQGGAQARYVPTGHLVYTRAGDLMGAMFDLDRLQVIGTPVTLMRGVMENALSGAVQFSFSDLGSLVYLAGTNVESDLRQLVWVNRAGEPESLAAPPRAYVWPRLSPDGTRVAVRIGTTDIWVYDITRGTLARLTLGAGVHDWPIWTPDGKGVTFASRNAGSVDLFSRLTDGSGSEERLTAGEFRNPSPDSYSPDGRVLVSGADGDIWVLPMDGDRKPQPFLRTPFTESHPRISPDGRWLAYRSNESGRFEVYVRPFPGPGERHLISTDGATEPVWSRGGQELFYRSGDQMMAVDIVTTPGFRAGKARVLFEGYVRVSARPNYDVAADGRFLMVQAVELQSTAGQLNVVLNWFEELKRRVPTK